MSQNDSYHIPPTNNNNNKPTPSKKKSLGNLSQLGKSISLTTHALLNKSDTILSSKGPYNQIMKSTLKETNDNHLLTNTSLNIINNNLDPKGITQKSNQYFKNDFINERKTFQLLSHLNDSYLNDIKSNQKKFNNQNNRSLITNGDLQRHIPSLYQGFKTLSLKIDHNPNDNKLIGNQSIITNNHQNNNNNEHDLIEKSYSIPFLKDFQNKMYQQLNNYEIKKNIAISEIENIDSKIEMLKFRRNLLFNNIANLEENELSIENDLSLVEDRISLLNDLNDNNYQIETNDNEDLLYNNDDQQQQQQQQQQDDETSSTDLKNIKSRISTISNDLTNETSSIDISQISDLLDYNNLNSSQNLTKFFQMRNKRNRKISPTLHQYFDSGSEISSLTNIHNEQISSFQYDLPFGHLFSTTYNDPQIKIWDLSKNIQIGKLNGHDSTIHCMELDKSYNMLISGSKDTCLKLWDLNQSINSFNQPNGLDIITCIYSFDGHMDTVTNISINSNFMISGSQDSTIRQWDLHSGKCIQTLDLMSNDSINLFNNVKESNNFINITSTMDTTNNNFYTNFANTVNNEIPKIGGLQSYDVALATGTNDGIVRLWDLRSGEIVRSLMGHTNAITCLKFDLHNIVTGSLDHTVRTWDLRMGESIDVLKYENPISSLDFDDKNIVVANGSNQVQIYDRLNKRHWECGEENNSKSQINLVQYSDNYLVGTRMDGTVNIWAI